MRLSNYVLLPPTSMATNVTTIPILVDSIVYLSLQAVWTGSPVGVLKLEASNDIDATSSSTTWSYVSQSSITVNGPGDTLYNLSTMGYNRLRLTYTRTSGTGTLKVKANAKGV